MFELNRYAFSDFFHWPTMVYVDGLEVSHFKWYAILNKPRERMCFRVCHRKKYMNFFNLTGKIM